MQTFDDFIIFSSCPPNLSFLHSAFGMFAKDNIGRTAQAASFKPTAGFAVLGRSTSTTS
jgi:hypothetical protein